MMVSEHKCIECIRHLIRSIVADVHCQNCLPFDRFNLFIIVIPTFRRCSHEHIRHHTHAMQTQQLIWKKGMKLNWFKHKMIGSELGVDFRHSTRLIWVECALSDRWFGFWWKRKKQQLPTELILISSVARHIVRKIQFKRVCFSFLISTNFLII